MTSAAELQAGKAQEGFLRDGKGPTYTLTLKAGDYIELAVDRHNTELIITVYDPAGSKLRAFRLDNEYGTDFRFVAEGAGTYRLEVAGTEQSKTGQLHHHPQQSGISRRATGDCSPFRDLRDPKDQATQG